MTKALWRSAAGAAILTYVWLVAACGAEAPGDLGQPGAVAAERVPTPTTASAKATTAATASPAAAVAPEAASAAEAQTAPAKVGHREGDRAPEFSMRLAGGKTLTSAELLDAGRPMFLFFWATW